MSETDDPRREFLVNALGLGLFSFAGVSGLLQPVYGLGDIPAKMPPGRSIYKMKGDVSVNGVKATLKTQIGADALVKTGQSSMVIFVVGSDAFILRDNSELQLSGSNFLIDGMRMLSGKLLSVFGKREKPHRIQTVTATIGIRGTGIYIESDPDEAYVCTCYGHTLIAANEDPNQQQEVIAQHHDQPLYVTKSGSGQLIRPAPFINHTDTELALIEELVGRTTPFAFSADSYESPRKRTY